MILILYNNRNIVSGKLLEPIKVDCPHLTDYPDTIVYKGFAYKYADRGCYLKTSTKFINSFNSIHLSPVQPLTSKTVLKMTSLATWLLAAAITLVFGYLLYWLHGVTTKAQQEQFYGWVMLLIAALLICVIVYHLISRPVRQWVANHIRN